MECSALVLAIKHNPDSIIPIRGTPLSAGLDLFNPESVYLAPRKTTLVDTGIGLQLPKDTFGLIAGRSSLLKEQILTGTGIVDADFQQSIKVVLYNQRDTGYYITKHQRIAQIIVIPCVLPQVIAAETYDRPSLRSGGFGSTNQQSTFTTFGR